MATGPSTLENRISRWRKKVSKEGTFTTLDLREGISRALLNQEKWSNFGLLNDLLNKAVIAPIDRDRHEPISKLVGTNVQFSDLKEDQQAFTFAWNQEGPFPIIADQYQAQMVKMLEELGVPALSAGTTVSFKISDLKAVLQPIIEATDRKAAIQKFWESRPPIIEEISRSVHGRG